MTLLLIVLGLVSVVAFTWAFFLGAKEILSKGKESHRAWIDKFYQEVLQRTSEPEFPCETIGDKPLKTEQ